MIRENLDGFVIWLILDNTPLHFFNYQEFRKRLMNEINGKESYINSLINWKWDFIVEDIEKLKGIVGYFEIIIKINDNKKHVIDPSKPLIDQVTKVENIIIREKSYVKRMKKILYKDYRDGVKIFLGNKITDKYLINEVLNLFLYRYDECSNKNIFDHYEQDKINKCCIREKTKNKLLKEVKKYDNRTNKRKNSI